MGDLFFTTDVSRRTLAKGAAWSVPAVSVAAAAPAFAASTTCDLSNAGIAGGPYHNTDPNNALPGRFDVFSINGVGANGNVSGEPVPNGNATPPRGGAPEGTNGACYWVTGPVTLTNPVFTLTVKINEFSTSSGVTVKDGSKNTVINVGESRTYSDTSRPGAVKANTLTLTSMSADTIVITGSVPAGATRNGMDSTDSSRTNFVKLVGNWSIYGAKNITTTFCLSGGTFTLTPPSTPATAGCTQDQIGEYLGMCSTRTYSRAN